jgi:hypothetical protein
MAAAFSAPMLVAYPGIPFTPQTERPYLRVFGLPARTAAVTLSYDDPNAHIGLFQVSVFWPEKVSNTPQGQMPAQRRADAVVAHFSRGTKLTADDVTVEVSEPPFSSPMLNEPGWIHIPVSIPYRAYI